MIMFNRRVTRSVFAAAAAFLMLLAAMPTKAHALTGAAADYNAIIFGDFIAPSGSDVEGRLAVGGNAALGSYSVGDKLSAGEIAANPDVLVVGGNLTGTTGRVYFGNAQVGGTANVGGSFTVDGVLGSTLPFNFANVEQELKDLSGILDAMATNGSTLNQWGGLTLTGTDSDTNVFRLTTSELESAHTLNIATPNGSTAIVNIVGESGGLTNMGIFGSDRTKTLFNFINATHVNLSGIGVEGSILAPFAAINGGPGVTYGQVVAASWDGAHQINHVPFGGDLPTPDPTPGPTPGIGPVIATPEPTTALLGFITAGFVALGASHRRRIL